MTYWPVNNQQDLEDLKAFLKESALPADDIEKEINSLSIGTALERLLEPAS
jgi:hypothetical protein